MVSSRHDHLSHLIAKQSTAVYKQNEDDDYGITPSAASSDNDQPPSYEDRLKYAKV